MVASALTADFLDMMPSTITVEPHLSDDRFGSPTYGPAKNYRCHVANKSSLIRGQNGETIATKGTVWIGTDANIGTKDRITLPDGSAPVILAVNGAQDEVGATAYVRVDFG